METTKPHIREIKKIELDAGSLGVVEANREIGFVPHRFYFLKEVPEGAQRGHHAHKKLKQFFVALSGSFDIKIEGPEGDFQYTLDDDRKGLYLPAGYWRELSNFSKDAVCGVFASDEFDEADYIRDYQDFKDSRKQTVAEVKYLNFDRMIEEQLPVHELSFKKFMDSGHYILGPSVEELETKFASWCGVKHAIGVASGLDALILVMRAWGLSNGDEVIVPANTYYASALAVSAVGATPVFVDCDPTTYNIDFEQMKKALTPNTKAVSITHLYGNPCDMQPVLDFAKANNLKVLEDSAQAHGATWDGKSCGAIGDAAGFSFYPTKNMGAFGDGGLVTTNDTDLYERVKSLRNYGSSKKYFFKDLGYNSRLDEMQASLLLNKLELMPQVNERRRQLANQYNQGLAGINELQTPTHADNANPVWHVYCLRVTTGSRDQLVEHLHKNNIQTNLHYPLPIHLQEAYADLGYKEGDFPISEKLSQQILSLPLDQFHRPDEIQYVIDCIKEYYS